MNVSLTPELEEFVARKVKAGLYRSSSEVVREALRLLLEREAVAAAELARLRGEIETGLSELDRGEAVDGDEVFREIRELSTARR